MRTDGYGGAGGADGQVGAEGVPGSRPDERLRVMLLAPPWLPVPPPSYGGTEMMVADLAVALQAAGVDVVLGTVGESALPVPTRALYPHGQGIEAGAAVEVRHLRHLYDAARDVDLVHDHTLLGPLYALAAGVGIPVVTTNHGPFDPEMSALYATVADRIPVVAISHAQARDAGSVPVARVVHHGVDLSRYRFSAAPGDHLLFLGRMHPTKGVREAVQAAQAAGLPLVIAAKMREPLEQAYFEQCVQPLLDRSITFVGEVDAAEKVELLAGARALVNPIAWPEPFGLVMVEALACGTPVLAFPFGAAPEIVEHGVTGFLCRDRADLVRRLGEVGALDRHRCRAAAERSFSATRMATDHLALYRSVLAGVRAGAGDGVEPVGAGRVSAARA